MHFADIRPIGYVEVQRSWIGTPDGVVGMAEMLLAEIREQQKSENPNYIQHGSRIEISVDGAGVNHYTLYMGFAPEVASAEPLNPRNLNDAPAQDQIGDPARDNAMGAKEQRF